MEQRASLITLGVADLAASRRFYVEGLGWTPVMEVEDEVVFFNLTPGLVLGLFTGLAQDAAVARQGGGLSSVALNLREKAEVDAVLAEAEAAGAAIPQPARDTDWGGRSGYFADPDGHLWEIAWNPFWPVDDAGRMQIPTPAAAP
jgi:catechol 2,3-dioxygenase-like lactoylglutathione lyase family enzyme